LAKAANASLRTLLLEVHGADMVDLAPDARGRKPESRIMVAHLVELRFDRTPAAVFTTTSNQARSL
jgi:hypothetical protein